MGTCTVNINLLVINYRKVERWTVHRVDGGSIPHATVSKLRQFCSPHNACVFQKRLKVGGPFYLVSMPGEVKDPI